MSDWAITALGQFSGGAGLPASAVTVAFATVPGSLGWPPSPRDLRRMAVRFDDLGTLVAHHVPSDHLPAPHPGDGAAHWVALAQRPGALPALMQALSPAGLPRHWRAMAATTPWLALANAPQGPRLRLHWQPAWRVAGPAWQEALQLAATEPDHADADLRRALARGLRPQWTLWLAQEDQAPKPVGELELHALVGATEPLPAQTTVTHLRSAPPPAEDATQAAQAIWRAQDAAGRRHLVQAWALALLRLDAAAQRGWLVRLHAVAAELASGAAALLGCPLPAFAAQPPAATQAAAPWPPAPPEPGAPLAGRAVGVLTGPDTDPEALARSLRTLAAAGAELRQVARPLDLLSCSAAACDAAVLALSEADALHWATQAPARAWVRDAFEQGKALAVTPGARLLLARAGVEPDAGVLPLDAPGFIAAAARRWPR